VRRGGETGFPTMRAAVFHSTGGPEVIQVEDRPRPVPGPGEALVQVRAAALNHLDLWLRRGLPIDTTMPHIGGSDVAGTVVELGPGVRGPEPGSEVVGNPALWCGACDWCIRGEHPLCDRFRILGEHTDGGFAEYVTFPADHLYPLPNGYSMEEAACLPVSYQTAWRALVTRAKVLPGEQVLVIGASGGTALAAVQIALHLGARVYAVTSGEAKVAALAALGAHHVFDRSAGDWSSELHALTGKRGVEVVVENVGPATWEQSVRSLARDGRLVTYGATTGPRAATDLRLLFWKQLRLIGTTMANRDEFEAMLRAASGGAFRPVISARLPLESARDAHRLLEEGGQVGKVVLSPDPLPSAR
jgi:NADPH:quinone reductase-like Zn-dependent oxidoreductase